MNIDKVFICSPYYGNIQKNLYIAKLACKEAVRRGFNPVCPHLYYTQFLNDGIPEERELGMKLGGELLAECKQMWVYGEPTEGMRAEIKVAQIRHIPIYRKEIPE